MTVRDGRSDGQRMPQPPSCRRASWYRSRTHLTTARSSAPAGASMTHWADFVAQSRTAPWSSLSPQRTLLCDGVGRRLNPRASHAAKNGLHSSPKVDCELGAVYPRLVLFSALLGSSRLGWLGWFSAAGP